MDSKRAKLQRLLTGIRKKFNGPPPPICPQIRAWAETTGLAEIIKIHAEDLHLERQLPAPDRGQLPEVFTAHRHYTIYDRALYRIPDACLRGVDGWITLPDGTVSWQTGWSHQQLTESQDYWRRHKGPIVRKSGNYFSLILYWALGYYHWFNDVLTLLYQNLELLPPDTRFIIPASAGPHYLKTLDLLGIHEGRRLAFDGTEVWKLENLWFAPPGAHPDNQTPGALQWLSRALTASLPAVEGDPDQRLYISRSLAASRAVANENEILPVLQAHGFRILHAERMPFIDQVEAFRRASFVIGPHGAGLMNLIFAPPGTRVLELFEPSEVRRCYWALCRELGHNYHFQLGSSGRRRGMEPDIVVDPSSLTRRLRGLFE
jgi:hypothetical protein